MPPGGDPRKLSAPAALRNRGPIRGVLAGLLAPFGTVLEIGAGSGEHAVYFAAAFPGITWQPTDADPGCCASIDAWAAEAGLPNLRPAVKLDVRDRPWPRGWDGACAAVVCINLVHIAPWAVCEALMEGAARALAPGGLLYLYGPFKMDGRHTAPSNVVFDRSLRAQDPAWGVRDAADVATAAAAHGLTLEARIPMPANNLSLVFRKA